MNNAHLALIQQIDLLTFLIRLLGLLRPERAGLRKTCLLTFSLFTIISLQAHYNTNSTTFTMKESP
jgi:hypothetical protein